MNTLSLGPRWAAWSRLCAGLFLCGTSRPSIAADPEFRGMWVTRFEWPSTNLATTQNNINAFFSNLQTHRFNAVMFQVRGQMDTLYPSPDEPWSPIVSANGLAPAAWGTFDPLSFAVNAAHTRGLEFHAYINTHVCWQGASPPNYAPANGPKPHPYWAHFNAADPNARDWLIHTSAGTPVQTGESNYVWAAPGVPDLQAYTRKQVMYVVENYDVDGVHFDRIRLPGPEYSYDPISQSRRLGSGNPHGLSFENWTRDQITRMLQDLYAQIMEVKPWIKVSSAPLGLYAPARYAAFGYPQSSCGYQYGYSCVYQDAQGWLAAGAMDFIVPQIYWADGGSNPDFSEVFPDWVANDAGRHIYAGQQSSLGIAALLSQINVTRNGGGFGNVVFSYRGVDTPPNMAPAYWPSYSSPGGPYEEAAELPGMPWKDSPSQGILIGNVTKPDRVTPVVDAEITRDGSGYVSLSSGDGLYSFLLVDPGTYTLTWQKPCAADLVIDDINVVAGAVIRVDVSLTPATFGDYDLDCDVDLADFVDFSDCLTGPDGGLVAPECEAFDADGDTEVDLSDAAEFAEAFTG